MNKFGISVPAGAVAESVERAAEIANDLGGNAWMVKAQIHAGGRGKAGGVKRAASIEDVKAHASGMLGKVLVTHQTGTAGKVVRKVLIEQCTEIDQEFYVGIALDRATSRITLMASSSGGVDIENKVGSGEDNLIRVPIDPAAGFSAYAGRKLAYHIGIKKDQLKEAQNIFKALYDLYIGCDCTLAEINPLVSTTAGKLIALDAKLNLDDSAMFRHPDIVSYRDFDEESTQEVRASKFGLTYIGLDGNIGCLVNGAGLAMATMDIIKLHGGQPANFLDAGGSATQEAITEAFKIILGENGVCAVLINIFAGILRCDIIAKGVVEAARSVKVTVPIVVRLEGTNVDVGREILTSSGLSIMTASDLDDAARKVVQAAQAAGSGSTK